jgi:hypothetical protein
MVEPKCSVKAPESTLRRVSEMCVASLHCFLTDRLEVSCCYYLEPKSRQPQEREERG